MLFRDDQETYTDFVFSPFTINISDDDDATMTKGQFRKLNEKLDSILEHSNALSSTKWENLLTTHRATIEMLTSTNAKFIEESSKVIREYEKRIYETTKKVEKLHHEVQSFMNDLRTSSDNNTTDMNKMIEGFHSSLKAEKEALSNIPADIKVDNAELHTTLSTMIEKLQEDLAIENKIMYELAQKTQKTKVLSVKLKNATTTIAQLEDERVLVKG